MSEPSLHACPGMTQALADERVPLIYLAKFREWGLSVDGGPAMQAISHCPMVRRRATNLAARPVFRPLEQHGLEPEDPDLPLHLRSDAWWRLDNP